MRYPLILNHLLITHAHHFPFVTLKVFVYPHFKSVFFLRKITIICRIQKLSLSNFAELTEIEWRFVIFTKSCSLRRHKLASAADAVIFFNVVILISIKMYYICLAVLVGSVHI